MDTRGLAAQTRAWASPAFCRQPSCQATVPPVQGRQPGHHACRPGATAPRPGDPDTKRQLSAHKARSTRCARGSIALAPPCRHRPRIARVRSRPGVLSACAQETGPTPAVIWISSSPADRLPFLDEVAQRLNPLVARCLLAPHIEQPKVPRQDQSQPPHARYSRPVRRDRVVRPALHVERRSVRVLRIREKPFLLEIVTRIGNRPLPIERRRFRAVCCSFSRLRSSPYW